MRIDSPSRVDEMTREELLDEIERLRWLVDTTLQVAWSADREGNITDVSQRWLDLTGVSPEQALGEGWVQAPHPDDVPTMMKTWMRSVRTGEPYDIRHRIRVADGSYRWMRSRAVPHLSQEGERLGWLGRTEDIHEATVASEMLISTANALPAMVVHIDKDLRYRFVNRRFEEILGRSGQEVLGMRIRDLVGEETFQNITPYLETALSGERTEYAMWVEFPTGRRFIRGTYVPSLGADGEVVGIDVLAADETENRLMQDALRESESQYKQIAEGIAPIVWTTLPDGYHDFFSHRWYDYTGMPRDGERGWEWKDYLHPDDFERTLAIWTNCLATGEPYEVEYRFRRWDGPYRWFLGQALAIRDENGAIVRWFGTLTDIHEQKEQGALLEKRVEERTAELTRANRDLNEFAYSVAHDLRSPLRAMVATSHILLESMDEKLTPEEREILRRQAKNGVRLARIIDDMLAFARLSKADINKRRFDMSELATATVNEIVGRWKGTPKVTVQPEMWAEGDPNLLSYVLTNLIDNAFKFSPQGPIVTIGHDGKAFFVRDQGVGFDMAHADKLFVAFERLVDQETFEGTGVGLAIVERIVERHGGRVWAESEPGKGSTFWFTLG